MSKQFEVHISMLRSINGFIRHNCEQAEAKVEEVNLLVRQLGEAGLSDPGVFLGPAIAHLPYPLCAGRSDSGQVFMAMLHVPLGIGVAIWDSEQYCELERIEQALEAEANLAFVSFAECEPAIKALLFRQIEPLLAQLMDRLSFIQMNPDE